MSIDGHCYYDPVSSVSAWLKFIVIILDNEGYIGEMQCFHLFWVDDLARQNPYCEAISERQSKVKRGALLVRVCLEIKSRRKNENMAKSHK